MASKIFPEAQHHVSVSDAPLHTTFDPKVPAVLKVQPGDLFHVETVDCYSRLITPENPNTARLKRSQLNPVTGPIFVEGALPGDILAVTLHDIKPEGPGIACCGPHSGQLCHLVQTPTTRFFDIDDKDVVTMRDIQSTTTRRAMISFPMRPMLGVIGVAPSGLEPISTMPAGKHGGNLDNKLNGIGSTIYIPVNHPGGLLSIGDMHASQGDGEISGTGVEIGGHVLLSAKVIKREEAYGKDSSQICEFPVTETKTHWVTHGVVAENIPQTTKIACEEAAKLLVGQWGFTIEEAFIFLSVQGDLGLCQSCHPDQGTQIARMMVPKLEACPRPFRCCLQELV